MPTSFTGSLWITVLNDFTGHTPGASSHPGRATGRAVVGFKGAAQRRGYCEDRGRHGDTRRSSSSCRRKGAQPTGAGEATTAGRGHHGDVANGGCRTKGALGVSDRRCTGRGCSEPTRHGPHLDAGRGCRGPVTQGRAVLGPERHAVRVRGDAHDHTGALLMGRYRCRQGPPLVGRHRRHRNHHRRAAGYRPFWPRHSSQADRQRKGESTVGVSRVSSRPTISLMSKPSMSARNSGLDRYASSRSCTSSASL